MHSYIQELVNKRSFLLLLSGAARVLTQMQAYTTARYFVRDSVGSSGDVPYTCVGLLDVLTAAICVILPTAGPSYNEQPPLPPTSRRAAQWLVAARCSVTSSCSLRGESTVCDECLTSFLPQTRQHAWVCDGDRVLAGIDERRHV